MPLNKFGIFGLISWQKIKSTPVISRCIFALQYAPSSGFKPNKFVRLMESMPAKPDLFSLHFSKLVTVEEKLQSFA